MAILHNNGLYTERNDFQQVTTLPAPNEVSRRVESAYPCGDRNMGLSYLSATLSRNRNMGLSYLSGSPISLLPTELKHDLSPPSKGNFRRKNSLVWLMG